MAEEIKQQPLILNKVFDPRLVEIDSGDNVVWSSESVLLAQKGIADGVKLKASPFLPRQTDFQLRRANLPFRYTEDELEILKICIKDKIFFGNNFINLKDAEKGWQQIKLRGYQEKLLKSYINNRWNIVLYPRQSGKTTTTIVEIVHFCISNYDKDVVVVAQSETVVGEILSKIKQAFSALPFFLQPGFVRFTTKGFALDNGCRLSIGVASESVVQGFSLDLLFIDEFAYIPASAAQKFWINIYPALTNNPQSKCIIASTPNGRNLFYELWIGAVNKTNNFVTNKVYWYDVPNRDEKFKEDTIKNIGLTGWLMGFECSFDTNLTSIFNVHKQKILRDNQLNFENKWSYDNDTVLKSFDIMTISKDVTNYNLKEDYFIWSVDISEGLGQDYSILKIRKLEYNPTYKRLEYKLIGVYRNNEIAVSDFGTLIINLVKHFSINKIRIVIENNNYGGEFLNQISNLYKYDRNYGYFDNICLAKFIRNNRNEDNINNADKYEIGIRWNRENKLVGVNAFRNLINDDIFDLTHYQSIEEVLNFGKNKTNNSYQSQFGHDDLVMADITASYFVNSGNIYAKDFLDTAYNKLKLYYENNVKTEQELNELIEEKKPEEYSRDGWYIRNHEKEVNKTIKSKIYF